VPALPANTDSVAQEPQLCLGEAGWGSGVGIGVSKRTTLLEGADGGRGWGVWRAVKISADNRVVFVKCVIINFFLIKFCLLIFVRDCRKIFVFEDSSNGLSR